MAAEDHSVLNEDLQSEIETLQAMYDEDEIGINQKEDLMVIDFVTKINKNKIKIIFAFKVNDIKSTIIISLKNIQRNKNNLNQESIDLIIKLLKDKFEQEIENMPIYQTIDYFNNELKENQSLFTKKTQKKNNKKSVIDNEEEKSLDNNNEDEFVAFIRFNHLLNRKQHKKENQMLSELKNLKNCSNSFFGYYFYGKPGIICICSTSDIIKQFAKKCNQIGKKSLISFIINIEQNKTNIVKNTIKTIHDQNEKLNQMELHNLLTILKQKDNVLSEILTGNETDFQQKSVLKNNDDGVYFVDCKYDFQVEIKTSIGPYATTNGNLYMTIIGKNENKLVDKYKFKVTKNNNKDNISFNFEFEDISLLEKVGILNKLYLENDSKDSWQCEWIKINVYQISKQSGKRSKKNKKIKPILKYQYEVKMRKWINKNCSRYAYLTLSHSKKP